MGDYNNARMPRYSMKQFRIIILFAGLLFFYTTNGQHIPVRSAAFYNVENLFDEVNDPAADDGDFTPEGIYGWTVDRFWEKKERIARVVAAIGTDLIGLAEVENHIVLDNLIAVPALKELDYNYIHFDSPDPRGIDVALLYRPAYFRPETMHPVRYSLIPHYRTREVLHVSGRWRGHPVHILVCHFPSVLSLKSVRNAAAESVRQYADSLLAADPDHLLLVMGDFNANPGDRPMKILTRNGGLENPFYPLYRQGYGTYHYRGRWNMYDSILWGGTGPGEPAAKIFIRDYLIQSDGIYKGYPYRSFSGTEYIAGYSDHLPVVLIWSEAAY